MASKLLLLCLLAVASMEGILAAPLISGQGIVARDDSGTIGEIPVSLIPPSDLRGPRGYKRGEAVLLDELSKRQDIQELTQALEEAEAQEAAQAQAEALAQAQAQAVKEAQAQAEKEIG